MFFVVRHLSFALRLPIEFCSDLSIHLIELPKFVKPVENLSDSLERWCCFLRYGERLETTALPSSLRTAPIEKAVEVLRVMTQSDIERERYESRQKALRDDFAKIDWAERKGLQQGLQKGLINSIEFGLEIKFGHTGGDLVAQVRQMKDLDKLGRFRDRCARLEHLKKSLLS